jgi:Pyruvate/2-oxoacid:ferredoxin oxidoreductase delta subunit
MIAGRSARNALGSWPSLRLVADSSACKQCGTCTAECPMSVDVQSLVAAESMEHPECVLCGTCVDGCPNKAIRYSFSAGK